MVTGMRSRVPALLGKTTPSSCSSALGGLGGGMWRRLAGPSEPGAAWGGGGTDRRIRLAGLWGQGGPRRVPCLLEFQPWQLSPKCPPPNQSPAQPSKSIS